jgi:hypothetical protein
MTDYNLEISGRRKIIGRREYIRLMELGEITVEAKIDTGAYRTVIHCLSCKEVEVDGEDFLEAVFDLDGSGGKSFLFKKYYQKEVRSSFGDSELRYCIRTTIKMGRKLIHSEVSLTDRSEMKFQVLIGRKTLLRRFIVDVTEKHLLKHPRKSQS